MSNRTYEQQLAETGTLIHHTKGNSMRPFIRSGEDLSIIEACTGRCQKYDVILYRRDNGQYVLHRIVRVLPDSYTLCGDNTRVREPGIRDDQVLGVLTGILRHGKPIDIHRPGYRLAVKVWCALFLPRALCLRVRDFCVFHFGKH